MVYGLGYTSEGRSTQVVDLNINNKRMSEKKHDYKAWEERIISEVNVQYYLRSSSGNLLLAAVGSEDSKGHMIYVVAKEYLEAVGSKTNINARTKWTKQEDVVTWLKSLVGNNDLPPTKLGLNLVPKHQGEGSSIDQKEKLSQEDPIKRFPQMLSSSLVHQKPHHPASLQVGQKIEILCQDSGMRGCWFVCKIMIVSTTCMQVQYRDVDDVDGLGKLKEWVPMSKLANPDKLGLRHSGRPTIRPCPPEEPSGQYFEVGAAVEVWWNDGWWESFVLKAVSPSSDNESYHVFLPGERKFLTVHYKDLRVAKDWTGNAWVAVKPQPDILRHKTAS